MRKLGIGILLGVSILILVAAGVGNFKCIDLETQTGTGAKYNRLSAGDGDSLFFRMSDEATEHLIYPNKAFSDGYVPYTGADSKLNMGNEDIIVDSIKADNGLIDTLDILEMNITTVYIDSGSVVWKDYDDLSAVATYHDTVFQFHKDVIMDETVIAKYKRNIIIVNAATYTVLNSGDFLLVTYTGTDTCAITIPTSLNIDDIFFTVKDAGMNSGVNNITVKAESDTIKIENSLIDNIINIEGGCYNYICKNKNWWRF